MQYISKKPVVIQAVQYKGDFQVVVDFIDNPSIIVHQDGTTLKIKFPGGINFHPLEIGNYLVREVSGYLHPVQKEVFESVYVASK